MDLMAIVNAANNIIWSNALIYLCLGAGVYFSVLMRFPQVRHYTRMVKLLIGNKASDTGVSSFQSFAMALGGRVGTGNIAGVATAIAMGGPGAVFWMWAIAFLGAGSAFIEAALAQVWKEETNGEYRGGPAYYFEKGLNAKWYGTVFAVAVVISCGLFLPGVQSNSIANALNKAFNVPFAVTGGALVAILALIIFGGVKRIGKTAELIVPFMAIGYIIIALIIIVVNIGQLPGVIALIFRSAFGMDAAFGSILGTAIQWGVKRGVYSNEAGQGTGPMAAAASEVDHPAEQGLVQAFSVYVDTLFVCSATAFMILITGMYNTVRGDGTFIVENIPGVAYGPAYTQMAMDTLIPGFGSAFVALALFFFVFTTLLAYYYYAESATAYLFRGSKMDKKNVFHVAMLGFLFMTFLGTVRTTDLAWGLGDAAVGAMAWLNIIGIILLTKPGLLVLKDYEDQLKAGIAVPTFDPKKLGIKNAELWDTINKRKASKKAM